MSAIPTCRHRGALHGLLAGLFVTLGLAQSPHLDHHAFDDPHEHPECPFASAAERTQALSSAAPVVLPTLAPATRVWLGATPVAESPAARRPEARAPPRLAS